MAHEIENMYYVSNEQNGRFVPWHGLGTPVSEALSSAEAIEMAGLNWEVESKSVYVCEKEVAGYKANVRTTDNSVLGIVSNRYSIVQNRVAFDFTDMLLGEGVKYETAGSLKNGKRIWLNAKLDTVSILGDTVEPYMVFTNTHDGTGAIKIAMTPIRTVCNNTLNLALSSASRTWSAKHVGDMASKLDEAKECLGLAQRYMTHLAEEADKLANTKITGEDVGKVIVNLFPIAKEATDRQKRTMQIARDDFMACYLAPDIQKFIGTKWGLINAASDFAGHRVPARNTTTYAENNFSKIIDGHPILDKVCSMVND